MAKYLKIDSVLSGVVESLCAPESYMGVYHQPSFGSPMPSVELLSDIVERLRSVLFPGFFKEPFITPENMAYFVGSKLEKVRRELTKQVERGFCFACDKDEHACSADCAVRAESMCNQFLQTLPHVRRLLATDVQAAFAGDPAAKNPGETIFCYPSIRAVTNHRIAHELHKLGVPLIPRIISEMAHSATGIDIHPGATIGESFFIDHGTGTVIGETCIIGRNVRLYQGVTLGAKSFPKGENGHLVKGIARHPIVEDNVTVYSGATILGRITIGEGAVIGGNMWVVDDVPPGAKMYRNL
ncbi:serine O-acetyltransferase EpsC [Desulfomicrobium escambiense]|uniref:serine O-acetyltransferase EpsC n=1 Tax=Desulfomicrobium escambiense TaxID=29503 RepID=UPI0004007186|nr:serine O-acetyltransferase EpsC [Desulfomicrobium escambiense]